MSDRLDKFLASLSKQSYELGKGTFHGFKVTV